MTDYQKTKGEDYSETKTRPVEAEPVLMNLLCSHEEINFLAKGIAQIARFQTHNHQYIAWEPIAIELNKYAIYRKT